MEIESGKKHSAAIKTWLREQKAPLTVLLIVAAIMLLDFAFRSTPNNSYQRGLSDMQAGKYDSAVANFSAALRNNPADPAARFALGWAYQAKGWLEEAQKQYDQANTAATQTLFSVHFNLGTIYQQQRQLDNAIRHYLKAIVENPKSSGAYYNLGLCYLDRGVLDLSYQMFIKAIDLDPKTVGAHHNAGLVAERTGKIDAAKKHYANALRLDPNFLESQKRLKQLSN